MKSLKLKSLIVIFHGMAFGLMSLAAQDFKEIPFDEFFGDQIAQIPLSFEIPAEYDHAKGIDAPLTYSYWMRGKDVAGVIETEELPIQTGYIYGKISLSVAYDGKTKKFTMEENLEEELKKVGMTLLEKTRFDVGEHPVWAYISTKNDVVICSMYVATRIDSNVIYFGYQPGIQKIEVVKAKWKRIVESLKLATVQRVGADQLATAGIALTNLVSIGDTKITFMPPSDFKKIPKRIFDLKWPDNSAPEYAVGNEDVSTTVECDLEYDDLTQDDLIEMQKGLTEVFNHQIPEIQWKKNEIISHSGQKWLYFEMTSNYVGSDTYRIMMVTVFEGKMLTFKFNSTKEDFAKYEAQFRASIKSIKLPKIATEQDADDRSATAAGPKSQ